MAENGLKQVTAHLPEGFVDDFKGFVKEENNHKKANNDLGRVFEREIIYEALKEYMEKRRAERGA